MKPYLLVLWNQLRLAVKKIKAKNLKYCRIEMLGRNTKLCIAPHSTVTFGNRIVSDGRLVIMVGQNAILEIGNRVYFNENTMISCKGKIVIGDGCKFGPNVTVIDNNHRFDAQNGVSDQHSIGEIVIGSHSWIGANAVLLKGTKIGRNCVIGAGCVISGEISDGTMVTQSRELHMEPIRK